MQKKITLFAHWIFLLLIVLPGMVNIALASQGKLTGGIVSEHPDWFKESFLDIAEDVDEATADGRHVILFMHLNGCPYCYKMTEENFKHAPYRDFIQQNFDVIAINIKGDREIAFDEETTVSEKELAKLLKVRATPTVLFLNSENKPVARLNGYRSVAAFKQALDYVSEKAYQKTSLTGYLQEQQDTGKYQFRDHPQLKQVTNLQSVVDQPLALLFEDEGCDACVELHDGHLSNPEINKVLENYTFVRLNALATTPIIDVEGNQTTPRAYAKELGLSYRPGIVLFDRGKEITRIDGLLYTYHFQELLRYVGERHYEQYPNSFFDYLDVQTEKILNSGTDIDLSK